MAERLIIQIYNERRADISAMKIKTENLKNEVKMTSEAGFTQTLMVFLESFFSVGFLMLHTQQKAQRFKLNKRFTWNGSLNIYHLNKYQLVCSKLFHRSGDFSKNSHFVIYSKRIINVRLQTESVCWLSGSQESPQAFCHQETETIQISTAAGSRIQPAVLQQCALFLPKNKE